MDTKLRQADSPGSELDPSVVNCFEKTAELYAGGSHPDVLRVSFGEIGRGQKE
jgi:hypothetical protein